MWQFSRNGDKIDKNHQTSFRKNEARSRKTLGFAQDMRLDLALMGCY